MFWGLPCQPNPISSSERSWLTPSQGLLWAPTFHEDSPSLLHPGRRDSEAASMPGGGPGEGAHLHRPTTEWGAGPGSGAGEPRCGPERGGLTLLPCRQYCSILLNIIKILLITITEKAMAPHSSTLAWKIPWMEEPGRLQSTGSLRVRYD